VCGGAPARRSRGGLLHHAWGLSLDDREWIDRCRRAGSYDEKRSVVLAWVRAAGGTVADGEQPTVSLPADLKPCMALVELRRVARDLKVQVL
jgi:hypothetical protein